MKFDLERALAGEPVMLRDGTKAYVRRHETELSPTYPLQGYRKHMLNHHSVAWTKTGRNYSDHTIESDYDIVGMWIEPTVFNHWDALEPKWKYIAADEDGDVCVFTTKPVKYGAFWANGCDEFDGFMKVTDLFNFQYTGWEHSLVARPSPKE